MRIGIYIEPVKVTSKTGISRFIIGLIEALVKLDSENQYYLYYQADFFKNNDLNWLNDAANIKFRPLYFPKNWLGEHPTLWWKYYLPLNIILDKIDVFHGPNHYIPLKGNIPTIVTIHDLAYYYMTVHGEGLDAVLKKWTNEAMQVADLVVAVSQSTAIDCQREGVDKNKIQVVYQGYESQVVQKMDIASNAPPIFVTPYLLFIGTIQPRKNINYIIESFAKLVKTIPHNLILAGAPGESFSRVKARITELSINDRVIILGYISDNERTALYQHAELFIYPSKYEGFGLVVLEAMSYGVPVITANNSSLPEAAGDAAILIDPQDTEALPLAIQSVINDKHLRESMIQKGFIQSKKFSWEQCALEMLNLYKRTANKD